MSKPCDFKGSYLRWMSENIIETHLDDGWVEIATPYLDCFNDGIVIYAQDQDTTVLFTDDGVLFNNTIALGEKPTGKKMEFFRKFFHPYSIEVAEYGELQLRAPRAQYPIHFNLFLQAIISANDMFTLRSRKDSSFSLFSDEIVHFFDASDVRYLQDIKLEGQSGIIHQVGFILPKHKDHPERLVYALNKPTKQNVELTLFNWSDIQKKRDIESCMLAFLNDTDRKIPDMLMQAFRSYGAEPIPWSRREHYRDRLAV